ERPHGARHVPVRGEKALRIQEAVGLLQAARRRPRRQGLLHRQGKRLPADEVTRAKQGLSSRRRPGAYYYSSVIARSAATKQSMPPLAPRWIASLPPSLFERRRTSRSQ